VLLLGETGTGKELIARAIHELSSRGQRTFVRLSGAALPAGLLESELFGYEKGAFTGADQRKKGRFELAEGGTLFLDEIGDVQLSTQVKLLRVLQEREFERLGGHETLKSDVRLIAATNKDLERAIEKGSFREDLFYRLNVVPLRLPPLRERLEDIPDLVRHFLGIAEKEGLPPKSFEPAAIERLKRFHWPGNIRELENLVRRLSAIYAQDIVSVEMVENELASAARTPFPDAAEGSGDLSESVERFLSDYFQSFGHDLPPAGLYTRILRKVESPLITAALAATRGNQIRAADLLGLNRNTLRKKIRDLGIKVIRTPGT
jgi:two-component system nitrogen regulation response regulator GlnG